MFLNPKHKPDIEKIIKRFDSPFFFYDLDHFQEHLNYINSCLGDNVQLWYACKANPLSSILKVLRNLNFGVDVASQGELDQAIHSGIKPQNIISTGPSKSKKYLESLVKNKINVVILESINQALWLDEIAKQYDTKVKALLRVQLNWEDGHCVLGGKEVTPFGVSPENWLELPTSTLKNLDIIGFHVFQWGNILDIQRLKNIWWEIGNQLQKFSKEINIPCQVVDLGGGLGIPYSQDEKAIDFKSIGELLKEFQQTFPFKKVWLELGRFLVGEIGYYITQVIDIKKTYHKNIIVTDGGINHIARPALTQQNFPCSLFRDSKEKLKTFSIHGPLCTALDLLGTFQLPEDVCEGDWLIFHQAGAYGFTEAMPFFLCHNLPAEVVHYQGSTMVPRIPQTSSNWMV